MSVVERVRLWKDAAEAVYITNMRMMWTTGVCVRIRMSVTSIPCSWTAVITGRGGTTRENKNQKRKAEKRISFRE